MNIDMPSKSNIAKNLLYLMKKEHLNQSELAKRANIPQPTIQRILASESKHPRKSSLEPIAAYFNLTIDELKNKQLYRDSEFSTIPIIKLENVNDWLAHVTDDMSYFKDKIEFIATSKPAGEKAFALKANSEDIPYYVKHPEHVDDVLLLCDPAIKAKDNDFVLIKLENHPDLIFRQLIFDLDQPFTRPLKQDLAGRLVQLREKDKILATIFEIRVFY